MQASDFASLVSWIILHGYLLFAFAAFIEGPVVTVAAGVAAALGYYSIFIIILIAIAGDIGADIVYYAIGYWGRKTLIEKYGHFIGLTKDRIEKTEKLLHEHLGKTLAVVKLSPFIPIPGLIIIGASRVPLKRFAKTSLSIGIPKTIAFALIGFLAGRAYERLSGYLVNSEYAIFLAMLIMVLGYLLYRWISGMITKRANA